MTPRLVVLALLLTPVLEVDAQRRMGFGRPPDWDQVGAGKPGRSQLSNKDLEGISPARFVVKQRKDLALSEEQVQQLTALDQAVRARDDSLYRQLDSLRKDLRPSRAPPEVERIRVRGIRRDMLTRVEAVLETYNAVEPEVLKLLSDEQQKAATPLLDVHKRDSEEMLREKMGMGGRRPGG